MDQRSAFCNFPSLQKLTIGVEEDEEDSYDPSPCVKLFSNAPLLREVSLIGITSPVLLGSLPWHQLTKFTGTRADHFHCMDALRLGLNLVECALAARGICTNVVEKLIHSSLKSLTLFREMHCRSTDIFDFLTLPALETLRILDSPNQFFSDQEFQAFLTRSSPPLRQFTIRLDPFTELDVDAFFSMPDLVEVEIWNPHDIFLSTFFEHFNGDVSFLPKLQHISFSFFHPRRSSMTAARRHLNEVQAGLTARWNARDQGLVQLKSFCFIWDCDVGDLPEDSLIPFRAMALEGLNISIKSPTRSYI
ncbi:hypothetical protein B0H12DRAFT_839701 [Mycena haematopus]|nr:hypothetical protein B0H12DRAFT_839701 [Mycena haematopus]